MLLSREARLVSAITLLVVPTIMYGGWTLLGILTRGTVSPSPEVHLDQTQWALWRAGHAHAGVWTILSLLLQIFLDSARLSAPADRTAAHGARSDSRFPGGRGGGERAPSVDRRASPAAIKGDPPRIALPEPRT